MNRWNSTFKAKKADFAQNRPQNGRRPKVGNPSNARARLATGGNPPQMARLKAKSGKKRGTGTKSLKKKAWKQFSMFIRLREADFEGYVLCFTCPKRGFWKEMQAGHFVRGRLNANLFDERGCQAQCYSCNIHRQGNVIVYYKMMLLKYGEETTEEVIRQNNETKKWLPGELASIIEKYRILNEELLKTKEAL